MELYATLVMWRKMAASDAMGNDLQWWLHSSEEMQRVFDDKLLSLLVFYMF